MGRTRTGVYAGRSAEARRDERRGRLIAAAVDVWAEQGWAAVTMRGVCARAGLTDRYFYESFADRDALLVAVWDRMRDEVVAMVVAAIAENVERAPMTRMRAAIGAVVHAIADRPDDARILLGDNAGSAVLEQRRHDTLQIFTDLLVDFATPVMLPGADAASMRMTTLIGVGGFVELVAAWRAGSVDVTADDLVDHVTGVATDLAARYVDTSELTPLPES